MDYNTLSEEFKKGNIDSVKEIIHNHNRCLKASDKVCIIVCCCYWNGMGWVVEMITE